MQFANRSLHDILDLAEYIASRLPGSESWLGLAEMDGTLSGVRLWNDEPSGESDLILLPPSDYQATLPLIEALSGGYFIPPLTCEPERGGYLSALAESLAVSDLMPLAPGEHFPCFKLALYLPEDSLEKIYSILRACGAGRIGNYEGCSFVCHGQGRFKPLTGAHPTLGEVGMCEKVKETLLLTEISAGLMPWAVAAAVLAHPYEEVVLDVCELAGENDLYSKAIRGIWTDEGYEEIGLRAGDKVAICHRMEDLNPTLLRSLGISWVIMPEPEIKQELFAEVNVLGMEAGEFYRPGLLYWQKMLGWLAMIER